MNNRLYLDLHVLQTVPPSCVNRDDTGSPKTAVYGGATRARVSSQAWKRAIRLMFEDILPSDKVGQRTKKIVEMVAEEIAALAPNSDADPVELAEKALKDAKVEVAPGKGKDIAEAKALFFISRAQARALAALAVEGCDDKARLQNALNAAPSVDMALFGRMVASDPTLNCDAAAQVAHSISTHRVQNEYDYFTAIDDRAPEDNAGAGHLGTVEYNSSTLYRYATVNVRELAKHLGREDAVCAVRAFAEAFIRSMPTGKQNTFANRTLPDAVYAALRTDQPVNLCGAFERAVPASPDGYVAASKDRLVRHAQQLYEDFAGEPLAAFSVGKGLERLAEPRPLPEMLEALAQAVSRLLDETEVS